MTTKSKAKISTSSQGDRSVPCVRCSGEIEPYTGRAVSLLSNVYAHKPGKCQDRAEQAAKAHAFAQDTLFGWSCAHVEPSYTGSRPESCHVTGGDRSDFVAHMKAHGKHLLSAPAIIRLRKSAPAARLAPINVPRPLKMLTWTETYETRTGDADSIYGQQVTRTEVERRGQFWANGPEPRSVWAITYTSPDSEARPELVKLWVAADGSVSRTYSRAAMRQAS